MGVQYATWVENCLGDTNRKLRVAKYNNGASATPWSFIDGNNWNGLNPVGSFAEHPQMVSFQNQLYIVWKEWYSSSIYVYRYDGTSWTNVSSANGDGVQVSGDDYSDFPVLVSTGTDLYLSWLGGSRSSGNWTVRLAKFDSSTPQWNLTLHQPIVSYAMNNRPFSMFYHNAKLYLAWTSDNSKYRVRVSAIDPNADSSWSMVETGGSPPDTVGMCTKSENQSLLPQLLEVSGNLFIFWLEMLPGPKMSNNPPYQAHIYRFNDASQNWSSHDTDFTNGRSDPGLINQPNYCVGGFAVSSGFNPVVIWQSCSRYPYAMPDPSTPTNKFFRMFRQQQPECNLDFFELCFS